MGRLRVGMFAVIVASALVAASCGGGGTAGAGGGGGNTSGAGDISKVDSCNLLTPASHNRVASGRVFTRRTAQSHRSMRVSSATAGSVTPTRMARIEAASRSSVAVRAHAILRRGWDVVGRDEPGRHPRPEHPAPEPLRGDRHGAVGCACQPALARRAAADVDASASAGPVWQRGHLTASHAPAGLRRVSGSCHRLPGCPPS